MSLIILGGFAIWCLAGTMVAVGLARWTRMDRDVIKAIDACQKELEVSFEKIFGGNVDEQR